MDSNQQRVAGYLALALSDLGMMGGARRLAYRLDGQAIRVSWEDGPYAEEVAVGLLARSGPSVRRTSRAVAAGNLRCLPAREVGQVHAELLVAGVSVTFAAHCPIGRQAVLDELMPGPGTWRWPRPLEHDGAARDSVLWLEQDDQPPLALVLRLPVEAPTVFWSEPSTLVALDPGTLTAVSARRSAVITRVWDTCEILLRLADPGLSTAEAEEWIQRELATPPAIRRTAAVVWPDRCLLHRWSGLRMEITCPGTETGRVPWTMVPSVAVSAALRARSHDIPLPTTVTLRAFGDSYTTATLAVTSTWGAPSDIYARLGADSW
ncbi:MULTISPECIES: hypothetical protein [unclassified Crossiella]|uniref:hypothetical protein n=1 Tax=unclassified Crossiella TaxID=2620835 RepID=UPI0020004324|nr:MULTISPECIES: hypothetical protein [unclassified Crossiella]MCK2245501.1 hypothetical protein [Crossiella sp. S99.2]MCK2259158.1 hypothetical protein [Crossiella sp. S99.1]